MDVNTNWIVANSRHKELLAAAERSRLVAQWQVGQRGQRVTGNSVLRLHWVIAPLASAAKGSVGWRLRPEQAAS